MTFENLVGLKYGLLTVVERVGGKWLCQCDCGQSAQVLATNLKKGNSKSCGCSRRLSCASRMSALNLRHGDTGSKEHSTWAGIVKRATKESSHRWVSYGQRGISMCDRWLSYESFLEDMGRAPSAQHTIDRIDNDKGYSADNCRWALPIVQAQNRGTNRYTTVHGEIVTFAEAARRMGVTRSTIGKRAKKGLVFEVGYVPGGGAVAQDCFTATSSTANSGQQNARVTGASTPRRAYGNQGQ
jgi:hypothetical protein